MTFTTIFKGDSILLLPLIVAWPTIFGVFGVPFLTIPASPTTYLKPMLPTQQLRMKIHLIQNCQQVHFVAYE
jgi:hypothetical protein